MLLSLALLLAGAGQALSQGVPAGCSPALGAASLIEHDFSLSFCELCDVGTARIVVENPFQQNQDLDFSGIVISEDLRASGLTYVANSTSFAGIATTPPAAVEPVVSGPNGSLLTWTLPPAYVLEALPGNGNRATLIIEFDVRRHPSVGEEGLVAADRTIEAGIDLTPSCAPADRFSTTSTPGELALREPEPVVIKRGRNVDAGQGAGSYSDPVYGHAGDDVIWRIQVRNDGTADLQDFVFSDTIAPALFDINYVCDNEADATAAAGGAAPVGCLAVGGTDDVPGLAVAAVFGGGANPYIAAPAGGSGFYYLVGRINDSCTNFTNTVSDVEWGCQVQAPPGGIDATSAGATAGDTAQLSTLSLESGLDVDVLLSGTNPSQPMGGKGQVRIRITNDTGGTIKGASGIRLRDILPPEYVVDTTWAPRVVTVPAYGNTYPGMIDTVTWTNPVPGTFPLVTTDPTVPLGNTDLQFNLTSSTVHPEFADQVNMIRHGDVVTVRFRTVLIDPQYYDRVADLDVRTEDPASTPPDTDPSESFPISNQLEVWFEEFCTPDEHHLTFTENDTARPEDLDVDVVGGELTFILTSTGDPLPLIVNLRNNGGHDADDYFAFVTFGEAMTVQTAPAGCSATTNPPAMPVWRIPVDLPATATVYVCDRGVISPGESEQLRFEVVKNTAPSFDDDLTFRADVIGEIRLSDGTPLWFPAPIARVDGVTDRANDFSLDGLRSRVVGFDLFKRQLGVCTENDPPPGSPDDEIQIGEECRFDIESGGWFGFETPGFTYIAVQNVQLVDQLPDGQGYITSTDPLLASTPAIQGVSLNPPPGPLDEGSFDWTFNTVVPGQRITERDHWFRTEVQTRLLNDPLDTSAAPNLHAALSRNVLTSTFEAIFHNPVTNMEELYDLGPSTVGFPAEVHRRADLIVTEPLLTVTKEVCNETRYGVGAACSNFVTLADDGDAFDTYVYRITVANEAAAGGVTRAPAYDVTVTSVTDPSDQLFVRPLAGDVLDNDGDALVDGGDAAGEGTITDTVVENGIPAQVIASYTHSDALLRIDAGESVELYYRVDPDDDVAPLQQLVASATASYDSLEGISGSQSAPQRPNGDVGGARQYVSAPGEATIQIIPVEVRPKAILRTSNTPLVVPPTPQPVAIGEEIEFELRTLIPVAQLRSFVIRDELPAGLSCTHAPTVDLGAPPYDAAGFVPGGVFTPTCTDTEVVWSFGNQTVTRSNRVDRRFDFMIDFIARVDNTPANQDGLVLRNGGTSTVTSVSYIDEAGNPVTLSIGEAAVVVSEPELVLTKTFSVPDVDAGDLPRVIVTATNAGSVPAYNPRVLEDLSAVRLSYAGDVQGTNPPAEDLVTFGPDRPLFSWAPGTVVAPGETLTFSFAVQVDLDAEPLEDLSNTIQADWTSLPGIDTALNPSGQIGPDGSATGLRNGALPNAGDALNDYEVEASASVPVRSVLLTKTDLDPAAAPEIGLHRPFEVEIALPEGTTRDLVLTDDLGSGAVSYVLADTPAFDISYEFVGIVSIGGLVPSESAFAAVPVDGASGVVSWSIGTVVTESEDDLATSAVSPVIRIRYFARINNDLVTDSGDTLQNGAQATFPHGETGLPEVVSAATAAIAATEPDLTATKTLTNETAGKAAGDPPAFGDVLQYVVTIVNVGNATAYDLNVVDTLPPEVELWSGFAPTAAIDTVPVPGFVSTPAGAPAGPLVWGRGNGDGTLDLAAGSFLELTYQIQVTTAMPAGGTIENRVFVDWTSREAADVYERTGDGCPTITPPDDYCYGPAVATGTSLPIPPPAALLKENTQATAAVGEAFRYRLTLPSAPYGFPQYDVRISDDLIGSAADLRLISVTRISGSEPWTPVNTGTPAAPLIEDPSIGIDIPAGEQIVLELTVVLEDTAGNVSGLPFTNTATYVYNWIDGNPASERPGVAGTSPPMTIVGPDSFTVEKSGPASMTLGTPGVFSLDAHNTGTGPAWDLRLVDQLPDGATGGTCDVAPSVLSAQVFEANGTDAVSPLLAEGTDYALVFRGAPDCELELAMLSADAVVGADQRLIVRYETRLDGDTQDGASLVNVAGAVEWFSADGTNPDTVGDRRVFTRTLTDGTPLALDHQDTHTVLVALPEIAFEKTVANLTTGQSPATVATPGDTLRYRLRVENLAAVPVAGFAIVDELDRLNTPPVFQPGSLSLVSVPLGAITTGTSPTGGTAGTGLLDVRGLALPDLGDSLIVEFDVTLAPSLPNGTVATNQSQLSIDGVTIADSDDPNVNGPADPMVPGDEDPTQVPIVSAPLLHIEKISTDLSGDPAVLLAGETLRYTITVENVGSEDIADAVLRDAVPVYTSYVPGSTALNGVAVPDGAGGVAPLSLGIPIQAPGDPTPGVLRSDGTPGSDFATLTFDVVIDADVLDGTVVSNQAFVSALGSGIADQPSDDPGTPIPDDPTRDVVGNAPLLFASKQVVIGVDGGSFGIVDPGDVLHYTITVVNSGAVPATFAKLVDSVPANTTWEADSLTLNGLPVGQPDGGVSPLAAGIGIQSSDLPPPLPGPAGGTLSAGESAVIEFDLRVDLGTPAGTVISNQARVGTAELPNLLTDGDGNPATGPEPTVVVVGSGQQLAITKQVVVVGGGAAQPGSRIEYQVRVTNVSSVAALSVVITDDLDAPVAGQLQYVPGSATLNGSPAGVMLLGSLLRAEYSATYGPLAPGGSALLRFQADIDAGLPIGTTVTNTGIVTWNDPPQTATASVSFDVGGTPGIGLLNGLVWHDWDFDVQLDSGELALEEWSVELLRGGQTVKTVQTDAAGAWRMGGVPPNDLNGDEYALRFSGPDRNVGRAALGIAESAFTNGLQQITALVVTSGSNLQDLNLPVQPNGVVYDSLSRAPVARARVSLVSSGTGTALPPACFDDPAQQGQVTPRYGYYRFDLNFSDPACPSGGSYRLAIAPPQRAFDAGFSEIIPAQSDAATPPFDVTACPGGASDAVPGTPQHCEAGTSPLAPPESVPGRTAGTRYQTHLLLDASAVPGTSQLYNNHLPVDPQLENAVSITKTTPSRNVSRGDLVPYEITVRNNLAGPIPDLTLVDRFPAGFSYVDGSARVDGVKTEPTVDGDGRQLIWPDLGIEPASSRTLVLLLAVGAGVSDGKFTNRAQAVSGLTGAALSGEATASVRVVPDPTFDCTDVIGKVFDDENRDGDQDRGEAGLPGVRLVTARGLVATTDAHGRFHITCAVTPNEERGSNFILKLDERSLPAGYRMSTRATQVRRATAGKALKFLYGASIDRVVGLDVADAVFEPGTATLREEWRPRLDLLIDELAEAPATLRLSYLGDTEDAPLVDRRLAALKTEIGRLWEERGGDELAVETQVYWRRGAPAGTSLWPGLGSGFVSSLSSRLFGSSTRDVAPGNAAERHLPADDLPQWTQDPERLASDRGDRLEERAVATEQLETVKLTGLVPPIHFESGVARIPESSVEELRALLADLSDLRNVRLHLVGHADDQRLSSALAAVYGDNEGLSRERAGEVAEYLQAALNLPPEAISFAYAGDSQPIASNRTAEGRAQNRRVEVEVWYDQVEQGLGVEEVVVPDDIKRVKVCRTETVCKLRYREGQGRRARIRNLIPPLHFAEGAVTVPDDFVRQVGQALGNLRGKSNVTVKLVGHTDDAPLAGRAARIYGSHLAVSKARAQRVARVLQDRLSLPTAAVASDGRGASRPLASNDAARGRALNRRVEVEFWYDDPLQQLPDEPLPCPDPAGVELETRVYDPPWGRLEPIAIEAGQPRVPAGYDELLRRALSDVADKANPRLRFVGYTRNERLDRRTAAVYGDDIGLSAARARRTMEQVRESLALSESQVEHEGRGYVHSNDVVNGGFLQGQTDHVAVQVVYDEPAVLDELDGIEITPITRELRPVEPLALNLMHISVDGEPIDDPARSSQDIQRCTDVALERADIRFVFDDLEAGRRLSVTTHPGAVAVAPSSPSEAMPPSSQSQILVAGSAELVERAPAPAPMSVVPFQMYTNYPHFIQRSEVRIFEHGQSVQAEPLAVVEMDAYGAASWTPDPELSTSPVRELMFVLRAYDSEGRFDETAPQPLWLIRGEAGAAAGAGTAGAPSRAGLPVAPDPLLLGYGESGPLRTSIPLSGAGTVQVHGSGVPPNHSVWLAGTPVPVDAQGNFVAETVLPAGMQTVEVAVLDRAGNGELFLRDLELERSDWFYVGIADLTVGTSNDGKAANLLQGEDSTFDRDSNADGRLAFFLDGRFGDDWQLTASADTREGPVEDLFKDFVDKTPEALFRRIDSDYFYPTFGDEGTVTELAPTSGKFFVELKQRENRAMWGNFRVGYLRNELAQVDRGLYGANVHYQSLDTTRFGEQRLVLDGFASQPDTVPSREEFRGTGGSLYYLRVQDLLQGSERLRVEIRDKDTGLVTGVVHLRPNIDYDIDYIQGRVLLAEPLAATAGSQGLVRNEGLSGDELWLVVQYEYTPGFEELDHLIAGGQGSYWLNDFVGVGATVSRNDEDGTDSEVYAADLTLRRSADSWLKLQYGRTQGLVSTTLRSDDGGFNFLGTGPFDGEPADADGYRADVSIGFGDLLPGARGSLSLYGQMLGAGYSAPGLTALTDTQQYGGVLDLPITRALALAAKADRSVEEDGLDLIAAEVDAEVQITDHWSLSAGVRYERREDDSPFVPVTQEEGERTDGVVQLGFDSLGRWSAYGFGQGTLMTTDDRDRNDRYGLGGVFQVSERLAVDGEASYGDLGPALKLGTRFQENEQTYRYLSYSVDNERGIDGVNARRGTLVSGMRTRLSDSSSVYSEDRFEHSDTQNGLSRSMGISFSPAERWSLVADFEVGDLYDRRTHAETKRRAGGGTVGYRFDRVQLSSGLEYRYDKTEELDGSHTRRTTWLFKNNLKYQLTPDWQLLGKFNHSFSDSSEGDFFDGGYTEAVAGFALRPVNHDRLNALVKYTYFENMPTVDQITPQETSSEFIQRSHIASIDVSYDITSRWSIGGKYGFRRGEVSLDRDDPEFFDNNAHLFILRTDYRFLKNWEGLVEGRLLHMPDLDERRGGALVTLYRYLGDNLKVGVGYNFTDFSEDLSDLSYDHHGFFFNVTGSL